jgi:hypothetical protein
LITPSSLLDELNRQDEHKEGDQVDSDETGPT